MKLTHLPISKLLIVVQIVALATGTASSFFPRSPLAPRTAPLQTVVLQLKWTHQFQFAGYYAALEKGYYQQAGLDVQIVEGSAQVDPVQQVLQGKASFGITTSDLMLWKARGFPVVSLAAIYQHSPIVILSNPHKGITNVHELAGKSLGLESQNAEILAYLKNEQVPLDTVTLLPYSFSPEAFAQGSIEATSAYLTDEPFELDRRKIDYFVLNPRASGVDFYGDCLFTTQSVIRQNPEVVKAFVQASLRGWQYALDNPAELADLILDQYHSTHSREHLLFEAERSRGLIMDDVVELGYQNPGRWTRIAETYAELGQIPGQIDLTDFVYDQNPPPDLTGLYLVLGGLLAVMVITVLITSRFYRLNRAIQKEMAQRRATETQLRQMEARYRTLVENAPFSIMISSIAGAVSRYINPQAASLFEITPDFAVGRPIANFYEQPDDRQILVDGLNASGFMKNWEVRLKKSTGEGFWANISATRIVFDGEDAMFVALMDITERKELERKLVEMARFDSLTGLFARGHFLEQGDVEVRRAERYHLPLALFMLDIDFFKRVNDTYGHAAGDQVLRQVAAVLKSQTRHSDLVGRLGGEEFGILLVNTGMEAALLLADRLREAVQSLSLVSGPDLIKVTLSVGVAAFGPDHGTIDQLMKAADQALYAAKRDGRNRVAASEPPAPE